MNEKIVDDNLQKLNYWCSPVMCTNYMFIFTFISGGSKFLLTLCEEYKWLNSFIYENLLLKIMFVIYLIFLPLALIKTFQLGKYLIKQWLDINYRENYTIEKLKETNLYLWKKKEIEYDLLKIRNIIGEENFKELIKETIKVSNKKRGNAYFYYILFSLLRERIKKYC